MADTRPVMGILCRKSKVLAKGDRLREVSSDEQERQGRARGDREGYRVDPAFVWRELGSAWNAKRERKDFDAAVKAVLSGEIACLWVYMSDRFSRKGAEDVLKVIGKARVIFDYDDLDSSKPRDRGQIIQEAERAREYSERLHARVTDIKTTHRDAGEWLGGPVPYGLKVDPKTRKLSPDESPAGGRWFGSKADVMRTAFAWLSEGVSARYFIRLMNDFGVRRPRGGKWTSATLGAAIRLPAYAGLQGRHLPGGTRTEVYRDANGDTVSVGTGLVTPMQQQTALSVLEGKRQYKPEPQHGRAWHELTGLSKCHGCGKPAGHAGRTYRYPGSLTPGLCPAPALVLADRAEAEVRFRWLNRVTALEPTDTLALIIAERWTAHEKPQETAELWEAQAELKAAQTVRMRLRKQYRAGDYEGDEQGYRDDLADVMERVRAAESEVAEHGVTAVDMGWLMDEKLAAEAYDTADPRRRNALLSCAIDSVTIHKAPYQGARWKPGERVTIKWADEPGDDYQGGVDGVVAEVA